MVVATLPAGRGGLIMAAPSAVFTIGCVAAMQGEEEDWLSDVALEMDPKPGARPFMASTTRARPDLPATGSENLKELIEIHKADPTIMGCYRGK
jgi:hypothetical protein